MIMVCGEALMDVFAQETTPTGLLLDARIGGSPLNVAIGLARLGQSVQFAGSLAHGFLGERLSRAMADEGVGLRYVQRVDAPTTLAMVGLNASGSASYSFYGQGGADRHWAVEQMPLLDGKVRALHFGSYSTVVEPIASAMRRLIDREKMSRLISYDPNLRINVEPDLVRWMGTVEWMVKHTHLLKISSEDLELLHPGVPVRQVVDRWLAAGVLLIVLTLGARGAQAFTKTLSVTIDAVPVQVVDTIGAGDTFQAALLTWLSEHELLLPSALPALTEPDLRAAVGFASQAAAITCARRGADLPRRHELR